MPIEQTYDKRGRKLTAANEFCRAAIYFHFAHYVLHADLELRKKLSDEKNRVFMRGGPLLRSPIQRVTFPFRGIEIAGYFRLPAGVTNLAVIVCVGGADTTKKDYLDLSNLCIERGLATFAFDGPGQGETAFDMHLIPDFEACIIAAINYVESRIEIDADRIGLVGRSLGGNFAPKAASVDSRIKALACWGILYDRKDLAERKAIYTVPAMSMSGTKTIEEAAKFYQFMDLTGHVQNIKCPVFLTHGGLDIIPLEHAYRFMKELPSEAETMIWDDAIHCCHDRSHIVRPGIADFFLQTL